MTQAPLALDQLRHVGVEAVAADVARDVDRDAETKERPLVAVVTGLGLGADAGDNPLDLPAKLGARVSQGDEVDLVTEIGSSLVVPAEAGGTGA
ncbi:hypothetical protein ACGFY7_48825 [Streptomyces prunicolor]|uniref:hypothetical protein n=1 Tax=Streptomyces prunicolor TaxID=67348 RepID=UPI0037237727